MSGVVKNNSVFSSSYGRALVKVLGLYGTALGLVAAGEVASGVSAPTAGAIAAGVATTAFAAISAADGKGANFIEKVKNQSEKKAKIAISVMCAAIFGLGYGGDRIANSNNLEQQKILDAAPALSAGTKVQVDVCALAKKDGRQLINVNGTNYAVTCNGPK